MRFRSIQSRYLGDGAYAPQIVQRRNPYEIQVNTKADYGHVLFNTPIKTVVIPMRFRSIQRRGGKEMNVEKQAKS